MRLLLTLLARIFHGKKLTEFPFSAPLTLSDMRPLPQNSLGILAAFPPKLIALV
jgi:hypothetical protein